MGAKFRHGLLEKSLILANLVPDLDHDADSVSWPTELQAYLMNSERSSNMREQVVAFESS